MCVGFNDAGCRRIRIALKQGPYKIIQYLEDLIYEMPFN